METAISLFKNNISRVRALIKVAKQMDIEKQEISADILRSAIVLLVSALDTLIHDIVRIGMVQILKGERKQTPDYQKFTVTMNIVSYDEHYHWFEAEIRRRHSELSFQKVDKIAGILKLVKKEEIWVLMANELKEDVEQFKRRLKMIVARRDRIAHESDIDSTSFGTSYNPIFVEEVEESTQFIETLGFYIYKMLST